jgi:hypothetical protein
MAVHVRVQSDLHIPQYAVFCHFDYFSRAFRAASVTELTAKLRVNSSDIQTDKPWREEDFADRQSLYEF